MGKKKVAELELKILGYLWEMDNIASVQEIIDRWKEKEKPGYTTILKKLQVMEKKELVRHEKFGKAFSRVNCALTFVAIINDIKNDIISL